LGKGDTSLGAPNCVESEKVLNRKARHRRKGSCKSPERKWLREGKSQDLRKMKVEAKFLCNGASTGKIFVGGGEKGEVEDPRLGSGKGGRETVRREGGHLCAEVAQDENHDFE